MDVKSLLTSVGKGLKSNAPEILAGLSVSGVFSTSYLVGKASFKAQAHFSEGPPIEQLSIKERVQEVWMLYIPAGISGVATIACIIGSSKANSKRTAAAMTAYSLSERAFVEYKEKVVEQLGKGKEEKLQTSIVQDRINANPPGNDIIVMGDGHVLCCELYTGRYFLSTMETLRKAENDLNHWIIHQPFVTLDDFYGLIGLDSTTDSGNFGWDSAELVEFKFTAVLTPDDKPCLAFKYSYTKPII